MYILAVFTIVALFVPGLCFAYGTGGIDVDTSMGTTTVQYIPGAFHITVDPYGNVSGNRAFSEVLVNNSYLGSPCPIVSDFEVTVKNYDSVPYRIDMSNAYVMLWAIIHRPLCNFNQNDYSYSSISVPVPGGNFIITDDQARNICANKEGTSQKIDRTVLLTFRYTNASPYTRDVRTIPVHIDCLAKCPSLNLPSASLPYGNHYQDYKYQFKALGGQPPLKYSIAAGSLPNGLQLTPDGVISGTANTAGNYAFSVKATDNCSYKNESVPQSFSLVVHCNPLEITSPSELPSAVVGNKYSYLFMGSGDDGLNPIIDGSLPPGIIAKRGAISGVPTKPGKYSFTMTLTDNCVGTIRSKQQSFSLTVEPPFELQPPIQPLLKPQVPLDKLRPTDSCGTTPLTIIQSPLQSGTVNQLYSYTLQTSGGQAPITFSPDPQSPLPAWLNLNPTTGVISGTPRTAGNYTFKIWAQDSCPNSPQRVQGTFTLTIANPPVPCEPLTITSSQLLTPPGKVNQAYSYTLQTSGGQAPITFSPDRQFKLPKWLNLNPTTGVISGTPPAAGLYTFKVWAQDSCPTVVQKISQSFTMMVLP